MHAARRLMDLAEERDLPAWRVAGAIFDGWTRVEAGEAATGIQRIRDGLVAAKTTGTLMPLEPLYKLVFADACRRSGEVEEGLRTVDETLGAMLAMTTPVWLSEMHRLKGELLLMHASCDRGVAEGAFRDALAIARQRAAQAWELRAALSLCRLLGDRGQRDEARQILGDVYGRFGEGFDTPNLVEARALLAELA
jgi:predicted ATPase